MVKKRYYIAATIEENKKYYDYVIVGNYSDNLKSLLNISGLIHATLCRTKKQAAELVEFWRDCHKKNGTYLFDD